MEELIKRSSELLSDGESEMHAKLIRLKERIQNDELKIDLNDLADKINKSGDLHE